MILLAIDTSSRHRLVCGLFVSGGGILDGEVIADGRVSESLLPVVDRMLGGPIDAVVVATGPGSYTGLRAGMAVALGVAHARDLPLYGVGAMTVVAAAALPFSLVEAIADAGRGFLYTAIVEHHEGAFEMAGGPRRVPLDAWCPGPYPGVALDDLPLPAITRHHDPLAALAAAAGWAATGKPLVRAGLAPIYVD